MRNRLPAGLIVAGAFAALALGGPPGLKAQQGNGHGVVENEVAHVKTHPLKDTPPIPPAYGLRVQLPLRHPRPLGSRIQPPPPDPLLQTSSGPLVSTTSGQNFAGVGVGLNGFFPSYAPPDTNGAAGATQYVQWVNVDFAIFSKSNGTVLYGPAAGNTIWQALGGACASNNSGDPIAQYDKQAQRWVLMQPVFTSPYYLCVAVSTTSDATGAYNIYQFSIPSNYFPDYPKLGVWPDAYYVSYNAFNGNSYISGYACALDRTNMLAGNAATMQCFEAGGFPSLLPSDLDGDTGALGSTLAPPPGSPDYFIDFDATNALSLFKFHVDWTTPANSTFTGPTSIPVASFSEACGGGTCIPQPGTNQQLDSLGDRLMYRFSYRNFGSYESLLATQSVDTGSGNSGVRWYEIRSPESSPVVQQQGTFAPDSNYRWMPSIAQDEKGDIAVGYSVSSGSQYPSVLFTGRVPGDPSGTLESEANIIQGTGSQLPSLNRWGDYSAMSVDPADDCTFWYTNEYLQSNGTFNWSTQIASFIFPGCTAPPTPDFSLSAAPTSQTVTQGNSTTFSITATPSDGYTGNVALSVTTSLPTGMTVGFVPASDDITGNTAVSSTLTVSTTSSTPTGTYPLTVSGTDGTLAHTTQVSVTVQQPSSSDFTVAAAPSISAAAPGSSTSYTVTIAGSSGFPFNGTVNLSVSGIPSRTSSSFSPGSITGSGSSTLTVSPSRRASTGSHTLTITGTSGGLTHSVQVTFVIGTLPNPDFSLSASPGSQTVTPGNAASYTVTVTPSGGYTGSVAMSITTPLPTGVTYGFVPTPVNITGPSATSTLTVNTTSSTPPGTYPLTVSGTDGTLTHTTSITLIVQSTGGGSFTISISPSSRSVSAGSGTSYTVTVTGSGGFSGTVSLSLSGLPSRTSGSFSPSSVTGSGNSTLTISTNHKAPHGSYTLTVTGTSGATQMSTTATLNIT